MAQFSVVFGILFRRFFVSQDTIASTQARVAWQWFNYYESKISTGKRMIRMNLDETPICMYMGGSNGCVARKLDTQARRTEPRETVERRMKRTYMTHVALLCDEPRLQPVLPQVLVGNPTVFRQRDMIALRSIVPSSVFLVRQKKLGIRLCF